MEMEIDARTLKGNHSPWRMALIIAHVPLLAFTMTINYLATPGVAQVTGLFLSNTGDISDKYPTEVTPAGWTFSIWGFIYTWQVLHVIYSLTLLCRKTGEGNYLYVEPGHIHFSFYIVYMANNGLNLCWIFLFDREYFEVSLVIAALMAFTIYICAIVVCKYLDQSGKSLELSGNVKDIWMTRLFTLNGLAFYGTWVTIATLLNLSIVLQHRAGVDSAVCVWIALPILTAELFVWFVLETFVFDRYLRYCFSPYMVFFVALSGVIYKQYFFTGIVAYTIYAIVLISVVGLLGLAKVVVMVIKGLRYPIRYSNSVDISKS